MTRAAMTEFRPHHRRSWEKRNIDPARASYFERVGISPKKAARMEAEMEACLDGDDLDQLVEECGKNFVPEPGSNPAPEPDRKPEPPDGYREMTFDERMGLEGFGPCVYCVLAPELNRVKIGFSTRPLSRVRMLQNACPERLVLVCLMKAAPVDERALHEMFRKYRVTGEWFSYSDEVRVWAEAQGLMNARMRIEKAVHLGHDWFAIRNYRPGICGVCHGKIEPGSRVAFRCGVKLIYHPQCAARMARRIGGLQ